MNLLVDRSILLCSIHHEQEDIDQGKLGIILKNGYCAGQNRTKVHSPKCVVEGGKDEL